MSQFQYIHILKYHAAMKKIADEKARTREKCHYNEDSVGKHWTHHSLGDTYQPS